MPPHFQRSSKNVGIPVSNDCGGFRQTQRKKQSQPISDTNAANCGQNFLFIFPF